jgi:hypothetical protein
MTTDSNLPLPAEPLAQVQALALRGAFRRSRETRHCPAHACGPKREVKPSGMTEEQQIQTAVDAVHAFRGR